MNEIQNVALRQRSGTAAEIGGYLRTRGRDRGQDRGGVVRQLNQDKRVVVKTRAVLGLLWDFTKWARHVRT